MKTKMRIVALVLVLAVALTGAGYAAWGSNITANTTLSSGDWEIVLENDVDESLSAADEVGYFQKSDHSEIDELAVRDEDKFDKVNGNKISGAEKDESTNYVYTIEPKINGDKDVVTFAFYNLHPGTKAITRYEVRNKGSIPAKIADITVKCTDAKGNDIPADSELHKLYEAIQVSGTISKHFSGGATLPEDVYVIPDNTTLANLEEELEELLSIDTFYLDPKTEKDPKVLDSDEMEVNDLTFSIPIDSLDGEEGENSKLKVSIDYEFIQYNVMVGTPAQE